MHSPKLRLMGNVCHSPAQSVLDARGEMIDDELQAEATPAEITFIDAVQRHAKCDLAEGSQISLADMAQWTNDRVIRSELLHSAIKKLSTEKPRGDLTFIDVRGAVIQGALYDLLGSDVIDIRFEGCRFDHDISFFKCKFLGDVRFKNCHFRSRVNFSEDTFNSFVDFSGSKFSDKSSFSASEFTRAAMFEGAEFAEADFSDAIFHETAWISSCRFNGKASFFGTKFDAQAYFDRSKFMGDVTFFKAKVADSLHLGYCTFFADLHVSDCECAQGWFAYSNFMGKVSFSGTTFSDFCFFASCIFYEEIDFNGASFSGRTHFASATFLRTAKFYRTYLNDVSFENAVANEWNFVEATVSTGDLGPIVGLSVDLTKMTLTTRGRVVIAAPAIDAPWLVAQQGVNLVFRGDSVKLNDSEFAKRSILSSHEPEDLKNLQDQPISEPDSGEVSAERMEAQNRAHEFRAEVFRSINSLPLKCQIESIERSNVSELVLADVVLDRCRFSGAHGLDKLRLGSNCSFQWIPRWWQWRKFAPNRIFTRRRLLYEELLWRRKDKSLHMPSPLEISSIYRDLRKSLEDGKNEPAAADFYYGEMEMRRLARRTLSPLTGRVVIGAPFVERVLLTIYWALSGYGLRASRALVALAALVLLAAALFMNVTFATVSLPQTHVESFNPSTGEVRYASDPPPFAPDFLAALEFSARESLSLLQPGRPNPGIVTRGLGTPLDLLLRLGGPALLALAVLAVRGRTKR